ncbi:MAG: alpha/beta fold hydrolase [Rhodospirillaceae bacterium]|nr:alpha/beta fold hydrolase [Rhodospirillaceae bacterium]MBT7451516.1 alpha/beta fold hydrolase [Rhodospirillaceae bacterium]
MLGLRFIASLVVLALLVSSAIAEERTHGVLAEAPGPLKGLVRGKYADSSSGQVHFHIVNSAVETDKIPFVIFHPNPYSGLYFSYLLEDLGRDRSALAPDTPGYGNSTKPSAPLSMKELGEAMAAALENLGYGENGKGQVDVSGYHTGAYIATELAAARPDLVRRVVLIGVPFWQGDELEKQRAELTKPTPVDDAGKVLEDKWRFAVSGRNPLVPLDRAYDLFIESLQSGSDVGWAYTAVLGFDAETQFAAITQPVLLLNTHGGLREETRAVLPYLQNGRLVEEPGLTHGIFDVGAPVLGKHLRAFLDSDL